MNVKKVEAQIETEEKIRERLGPFYISIWKGCDSSVAAAIGAFRESWHKYSEASNTKNLVRLVKEIIDPAIATFMDKYPPHYMTQTPVSLPEINLSDIVKAVGFRRTVDLITAHLGRFIDQCEYSKQDKQFIATHEALKHFCTRCDGKRPQRSKLTSDIAINTVRPEGLCAFCGNQTEFTTFIAAWTQQHYLEDEITNNHSDIPPNTKKRPDLSHTYCPNHRPMKHDGTWNPQYKKAKRSAEQFEIEVSRLRWQVAQPNQYHANSGDDLIDEYFYHYLKDKTLKPEQVDALWDLIKANFPAPHIWDDEKLDMFDKLSNEMTDTANVLRPDNISELRNLARDMVDQRLTDDKKIMLVLRKRGLTQREIAEKLTVIFGKNYTHQGVSRSLAAVSKAFRLDD